MSSTVQALLTASRIPNSSDVQHAPRGAVEAADYDLVEYLLNAHASPDFVSVGFDSPEAKETLMRLISEGLFTEFDPYSVGLNILYAAAIRGHHWIVELLLRYPSPLLTRKLWNIALK
jgi:hypothetical protein